MELIRELLRDLVGIIFPGGLFIILTLWFIFVVTLILPDYSFDVLSFSDSSSGFLVLLIISYIAGQSLRMKQLYRLERKCTKAYRKKHGFTEKKCEEMTQEIEDAEQDYYAGRLTLEELKDKYRKLFKSTSWLWEEFPYPHLRKGRRLLRHPWSYFQFFEKYDRQGVTKHQRFFNFCKSVIYEYSSSFKEEMIRQEALVRLFAGIYHVAGYGKYTSVLAVVLHLATIVLHQLKICLPFVEYSPNSWGIVVISGAIFGVCWYLDREILDRLRYMRAREVSLAYDSFYLICKKHELDFDASPTSKKKGWLK